MVLPSNNLETCCWSCSNGCPVRSLCQSDIFKSHTVGIDSRCKIPFILKLISMVPTESNEIKNLIFCLFNRSSRFQFRVSQCIIVGSPFWLVHSIYRRPWLGVSPQHTLRSSICGNNTRYLHETKMHLESVYCNPFSLSSKMDDTGSWL